MVNIDHKMYMYIISEKFRLRLPTALEECLVLQSLASSSFSQRRSVFLKIITLVNALPIREGLEDQMFPKSWHCQKGGGALSLARIFLEDLSTRP